jgi:hypothetical protein
MYLYSCMPYRYTICLACMCTDTSYCIAHLVTHPTFLLFLILDTHIDKSIDWHHFRLKRPDHTAKGGYQYVRFSVLQR